VGVSVAAIVLSPSGAESERSTQVTPAGWRVAPAGTQITVDKIDRGFQGPLGSALSPDGTRLLSVSSGAARIDSTDLFDLAARRRQGYVPYDATRAPGEAVFYGVAWSPDGHKAWASGGGQDVVHVYEVDSRGITETGQVQTPFFPAGMAYGHTPTGDRLYVVNNLSGPASNTTGNMPGYQVTVLDPATDTVRKVIELGSPLQPVGVTFDRSGAFAYVTNWMGRSVSVIDTATETKVTDIELSPANDPLQADHPSGITANPGRDEVYTANSSSDTVSVIDTRANRLVATIDVALVPGAPKGATPDGLSVSPDGTTLYVAEAGENAVAVVDLDRRQTQGFLPTGWYPADVELTPDGRQLVVTNTNDSGAGPNPCGPLTPRTDCPPKDPQRDDPRRDTTDPQYTGSMIKGSIQVVDVPRSRGQLRASTARVRANNQVTARSRPKPRALEAIKHVIYVVKENRTYDQVFGNLGKGNGDPSLNLFGDDSAPNHRALARRFALFDNFYADAEVSADGHNWITQANATDYVDKTWPVNYSPRPRGAQRIYDFENMPLAAQFPTEPLAGDPSVPRTAAAQTAGYLWDNAYSHGVSFRDYGEYTRSPGDCSEPAAARNNESDTTHLNDVRFGDHVDNRFPGYNMACSDHAQREPEWEREFRGYEAGGDLPGLSIVRLPSDHTRGTTPGAATPQSFMADNDAALGRLVEVVSKSRYWPDTAIVVTEDDAQNGPDHVDAHRTVALVISPNPQHAKVDSTHYDTSSMVATIEDLLGLAPMSIVDQRATRMWAAFSEKANLRPYDATAPSVVPFGAAGAPTNTSNAPLAATSAGMNFAAADATPEIPLNQAIWKSIRGESSKMPDPRHDLIAGGGAEDEDEGG